MTAATPEKYYITLGDRLVVAKAQSYESLLADWMLLNSIDLTGLTGNFGGVPTHSFLTPVTCLLSK